ncbi:MAG: phosphoheptose isomerase [Marinilabiliales bacterium]|nr:MAG: phosphoheptose isomerase [Marinilabiliales bacterium]
MKFIEYSEKIKTSLNKLSNESINKVLHALYKSILEDRTIFIIGNGGSAANASHLAIDLSRLSFEKDGKTIKIRALSLTDNVPYITATANDFEYQDIFTEQLKNYSKANDTLIAISCSGNSENIVKAVEYAKTQSMTTIGISGFDGGKILNICDYNIHVDLSDFGVVESINSAIFHYFPTGLELIHQGKDA